MYNPLSLIGRRRRAIRRVLEDVSSINSRLSAMSKQITDLVKAYEKHNQHNESVQRALEHQLMNKSAFIERLLENSLVTGNGKAEHKADSSLIDISKLSPATQSYIKTQIEKADKPNGVAKI